MSPWICKHTDLKMRALVADKLEGEERERAERHLQSCERCRRAVSLWSGFVDGIQKAEPEPPSQAEKQRIIGAALSVSRTEDSSRHASAKLAWIGALAACAAMGVFVFLRHMDEEDTAVALKGRDSVGDSMKKGTITSTDNFKELSPTSEISPDRGAYVRLSDDVLVWADQRARWSVKASSGQKNVVDLCAGMIVVEIGPFWGGGRFIVETPEGEIEARGTVFSVDVDEAQGARATVESGVVELRRRAGGGFSQSYTLESGTSGSLAETISRPASSEDIRLISRFMAGAAVEREAPKQKGELEHVGSEQAVDEELSRLLVEAKDLRKAGDFQGAAGIYKSILTRNGKSSGALDALVSMAQIELNELSKPTDALQHYKDYLEASPDGFHAETARIGLVRTADVLGLEEEIVRASEEYERFHRAGPFSAEVAVLKADALRRLGRCEEAAAAYRRVLESWPHSGFAKQARHGLILCGGN